MFCLQGMNYIKEKPCALDAESTQVKDLFDDGEIKYLYPYCDKQYRTKGGIKRYLKTSHEISFDSHDPQLSFENDPVALYRATLMKSALVLLNSTDANKMGDGNRVAINTKFQMLLVRVGYHTKYQLWLFRYLAYIKCILPPQLAYE